MAEASSVMNSAFIEWIGSLELEKAEDVAESMKYQGFYKLLHLNDFDIEEDLENLPLKKAEKKRFISSFKELITNNWQPSFETKNQVVTRETSQPKEVTLEGVKMTGNLRKKFEKENIIIPNPLNEKQRFFNKLFPSLFCGSYSTLQCNFSAYFKSERKERWEFKCSISKSEAKYDTLVNKTVGDGGGHGLSRFYVMPAKVNKHDISVIKNGIDELDKLRKNVQILREKLVDSRKDQILNKDGVVKRWAQQEQEPYNRDSLQSCEQLDDQYQMSSLDFTYFILIAVMNVHHLHSICTFLLYSQDTFCY